MKTKKLRHIEREETSLFYIIFFFFKSYFNIIISIFQIFLDIIIVYFALNKITHRVILRKRNKT